MQITSVIRSRRRIFLWRMMRVPGWALFVKYTESFRFSYSSRPWWYSLLRTMTWESRMINLVITFPKRIVFSTNYFIAITNYSVILSWETWLLGSILPVFVHLLALVLTKRYHRITFSCSYSPSLTAGSSQFLASILILWLLWKLHFWPLALWSGLPSTQLQLLQILPIWVHTCGSLWWSSRWAAWSCTHSESTTHSSRQSLALFFSQPTWFGTLRWLWEVMTSAPNLTKTPTFLQPFLCTLISSICSSICFKFWMMNESLKK